MWWRRYDTCRHMGWSVWEYDHTPLIEVAETEYAIALERRHQAAAAGN